MKKRVVVIGGGHGQSTILRGIKDIDNIDITAIVTVADDGGSTGRIRNLYQIPAMGDIRNVMIAMSKSENFMKDLMDYRFEGEENEDVVGHNLGNLILTALTQITGSFMDAILTVSKVLNVSGKIIPSSLEVITLYALMDDDTIVKGEANIPNYNHHIKKVFYDKEVKATKEAIEAIEKADLVIYGIGSVYTSILPNVIIKGIREALHNTKAKRVYFANCMTQNNETFDFDLFDYVSTIERHGAPIDLVIKHSEVIPFYIKSRYLKQNSIEVMDKGDLKQPVIECELLTFKDNLVRHDPQKIKKVVEDILKELD